MGNFEAMCMAIWAIAMIMFILRVLPLLVFLPQILFVVSAIEEELSLLQDVKICWLLSGDLDLLLEAIDALNNKESINFEFFDDEEDDDDDGDLAYYKEDLCISHHN